MSRKKLSEMTPYEKIESRLRGMTNEEAEDVAVKILSQIIAKHVFSIKDGDDYVKKLISKLMDGASEYAKDHSFELACASVFLNRVEKLKNS